MCVRSASSAGRARSASAPASRWVGAWASAARPAWRDWWPPWPSGAGRGFHPARRGRAAPARGHRARGARGQHRAVDLRRRRGLGRRPRRADPSAVRARRRGLGAAGARPPPTSPAPRSPHSVAFADAVFNVGRTALLVAALAAGNVHALRTATEDRLHQDQRFARSPGSAPRAGGRARGRRLVRLAVGIRTDHRHPLLARGGRSAGGGLARRRPEHGAGHRPRGRGARRRPRPVDLLITPPASGGPAPGRGRRKGWAARRRQRPVAALQAHPVGFTLQPGHDGGQLEGHLRRERTLGRTAAGRDVQRERVTDERGCDPGALEHASDQFGHLAAGQPNRRLPEVWSMATRRCRRRARRQRRGPVADERGFLVAAGRGQLAHAVGQGIEQGGRAAGEPVHHQVDDGPVVLRSAVAGAGAPGDAELRRQTSVRAQRQRPPGPEPFGAAPERRRRCGWPRPRPPPAGSTAAARGRASRRTEPRGRSSAAESARPA